MTQMHTPAMPTRTNPIHEARGLARWLRERIGRDLRVARHRAGMTQLQTGRLIGRSASWISRVEAGKVPGVSVTELVLIGAAVGMKLSVGLYPAGRRPLDGPQLALLTAFNARIAPEWRRELEKVMPREGDLRAVDELISTDTCSCAVEALTRIIDWQGQLRPARAKQRDLGATRLILVILGSHANRRMLHELGPIVDQEFPVATREAMRALAAGQDPGGDCLIIL
jgi:transcriptional regulator with XRE-family HTH domain